MIVNVVPGTYRKLEEIEMYIASSRLMKNMGNFDLGYLFPFIDPVMKND